MMDDRTTKKVKDKLEINYNRMVKIIGIQIESGKEAWKLELDIISREL